MSKWCLCFHFSDDINKIKQIKCFHTGKRKEKKKKKEIYIYIYIASQEPIYLPLPIFLVKNRK